MPLPMLAMTVKKLQVSFEYQKQGFQYPPHQYPPTEPSLPPSVSATSGIDQSPTIQKRLMNSLPTPSSRPFLFQILFQIQVYWNHFWVYDDGHYSPGVDVLGRRHVFGK